MVSDKTFPKKTEVVPAALFRMPAREGMCGLSSTELHIMPLWSDNQGFLVTQQCMRYSQVQKYKTPVYILSFPLLKLNILFYFSSLYIILAAASAFLNIA